MSQRKKDGATLALVIILAFVLIIVGGCFFVWQLLVGGGKELQHATDSGNLNVAKQALITPDVVVPDSDSPITNTNLRKEFEEVLDGGTKVNLLNFNRLVAKAVYAQLNAQSQGTALAKANAIALTQAVYDLGQQLQQKLDSSSSLKGHFEQMSNSNSIRMLQHPTQTSTNAIAHRDAEYQTSYMARGKASNVYFDKNAFPPDAPLPDSDMIADAGGKIKTYLKGYSSISSASNLVGCPVTWAVPLRPGEQPHLVSVDDFTSKASPPFPNAIANSFKSGGSASFIRTGTDVELRSCAIVGVLEKVFPAIQSGGTIIVDNEGVSPFSGDIDDPGSSDLYKPGGKLMAPKGVEVFEVTCMDPNGHFTDGQKTHRFMCHFDPPADSELPSTFIQNNAKTTINSGIESDPSGKNGAYDKLRTFHDTDSGKSNLTMGGEDYWAMKMHGQTRYVSQYADRNRIMGVSGGSPGTTLGGIATNVRHIALCNGSSFEPVGQPVGSASPSECNKTSDFAKLCNGELSTPPGGSTHYENLMPLEQYILTIIAGFGGAGCVTVPALGPVGGCGNDFAGSGMKHIDTGGVPFQEGNLATLLQDTNAPSSVRRDLEYRIKQIVAGADPSNIIDGAPVPFNKLLYIHKGANGQVVMDTTKPASLQYDYASQNRLQRPIVDPVKKIPDGELAFGRKQIGVSGTWVPGFMWECGGGQSSGVAASVVKWYPSSGKGGLLGVLKFNNCPEANGPDWCCP